MLGLGDYDSSDEEDVIQIEPPEKVEQNEDQLVSPEPTRPDPGGAQSNNGIEVFESGQAATENTHPKSSVVPNDSELTERPILGPTVPRDNTPSQQHFTRGGSLSPQSQARTLIRDLTLPPIANLDIPPSPPGSPDPRANAKFAHFLTLKKQAVHFNEKLATSSALKNPGLLVKLMEHAGINGEAQYANALPADSGQISLPRWGYKDELNIAQQRYQESTAANTKQRSSVDFVAGGQL